MTLLLAGFLCLGALAIFAGITFARRRDGAKKSAKVAQWGSGVVALLAASYIWSVFHSLTIVTVTSSCPEYIGIVSAGERHTPWLQMGGTDYFWFTDPQEGAVSVEGKKGTLLSYGYVASLTFSRLEFRLALDCTGQAKQTYLG